MIAKKNITIAFDQEDFEYVDEIKATNKIKSSTQVFIHILDFYRKYIGSVELMEKSSQDIELNLNELKSEIQKLKVESITKNEIDSLRTNIDLIIQNQDILKPLIQQLSNLSKIYITKGEFEGLKDQISLLNKIISTMTTNNSEVVSKVGQEKRDIAAMIKAQEKLKEYQK